MAVIGEFAEQIKIKQEFYINDIDRRTFKMIDIKVAPACVWDYFQKNKAELEDSMHQIAENKEFGSEIYLSCERGCPVFTVIADGYQYEEEAAIDKDDCYETASNLYQDYLTSKFLNPQEESLLEVEDSIEEREMEIDEAIIDLINAIEEPSSHPSADNDEICDDIKEHILEYMARKHSIKIRRPMMLEDENGEDFYSEYPYECMIFEDEDNPIYKKN